MKAVVRPSVLLYREKHNRPRTLARELRHVALRCSSLPRKAAGGELVMGGSSREARLRGDSAVCSAHHILHFPSWFTGFPPLSFSPPHVHAATRREQFIQCFLYRLISSLFCFLYSCHVCETACIKMNIVLWSDTRCSQTQSSLIKSTSSEFLNGIILSTCQLGSELQTL